MQQKLEEIDKKIESFSQALSRTPDDDQNKRGLLASLGKAHDKRYDLLEEPHDIQKMIEYTTIVLTLTPDDDPGMQDLLSSLGIAHNQRYHRLGGMNDMEKSIEYNRLALALTPAGHLDLPRHLSNLAMSHKERFQRLGELGDIEKAIEYDSLAVAATPNDHPDLWRWLGNLGTSHLLGFQRQGELDDLEQAIQFQSRGLALAPEGHPILTHVLSNLATSHSNRYQRLGELDDLEKAIEHYSRALALTPDGHPDLSSILGNVGVSHKSRFQRLGELDDLEKAIECESRALALTPDDHPDLSTWLGNLGVSHNKRFQRLGELDDLEKAIELELRALTLTPNGHPDLSMWLTNLGTSYSSRFKCLGELDDLEKAIEYGSRALALTPDSHPHLSTILANLGTFHSRRFRCLGELDDVEKAIEYESRALALTPDGHLQLSSWLSNLAGSHSYRFECLGELDDVERAIEHGSRAVTLTSDDHPDLPSWHANLGVAHTNRFRLLGEFVDLAKALEHGSRALAVIPDDHPDLCQWHYNHAISYVHYYGYTGNLSYLQASMLYFHTASTALTGAPRAKFRNSYGWAKHASRYSSLNCIQAYQTTINLLPQYIWLGATTSQRYEDLKMAKTLAVDAASAAVLSMNYSLALEWLEHARCIVWNQSLMLRSPLDQLQSTDPALATRLQTVANQLHQVSSEPRESQVLHSGSMTTEQVSQGHRRLAKEYNNLLSKARTLPGFEDFLLPMKTNKLVSAAKNGPIVVINCHPDRCDALLILPHQDEVNHLPLPSFDGEKARRARSEMEIAVESQRLGEREVERRPLLEEGNNHEFESVLAVLWNDVVKPILEFLGLTDHVPVGNLPHITWCPTGAMTFLPLHAAGDYDQPRSRVFDYVISSYTPTLTALLESTPYSLTRNSRVLAIGQTATPGHSRLPGTAMELEYLKAHIHNKAEYSQLINNQATTTAVLDAMERHDWVHLACHAHQNVSNATESGFFLHDGVLDLASINRRSLKNKGLAFLSACQTARGDKNLPDEAVHLASGMLMAGYTSVIATMWSVVDSDAPIVADKVYSELMKDGKLGNGEAGKALHNAVARLRERVGEREFGRWVPYIHIGS